MIRGCDRHNIGHIVIGWINGAIFATVACGSDKQNPCVIGRGNGILQGLGKIIPAPTVVHYFSPHVRRVYDRFYGIAGRSNAA